MCKVATHIKHRTLRGCFLMGRSESPGRPRGQDKPFLMGPCRSLPGVACRYNRNRRQGFPSCLDRNQTMTYVEFPRRRSQAAKAADCKSAIPGSNPGGASRCTRSHQAARERLTWLIPWTWDHPRFLLRIAVARTPSQAKAGFRVLRVYRFVYRFRNHSPALPSESLVRIQRVERRGWGGA